MIDPVDIIAPASDAALMPIMFQVALGGAVGSVLRWAMALGVLRLVGAGFPVAILSVNVVGSFLMGAFVVLAAQRGLAPWGPFVAAGLLGGFTTFSTFSLETVTLLERGQVAAAALYVGLSVTLSVGGLALGAWLARAAL